MQTSTQWPLALTLGCIVVACSSHDKSDLFDAQDTTTSQTSTNTSGASGGVSSTTDSTTSSDSSGGASSGGSVSTNTGGSSTGSVATGSGGSTGGGEATASGGSSASGGNGSGSGGETSGSGGSGGSGGGSSGGAGGGSGGDPTSSGGASTTSNTGGGSSGGADTGGTGGTDGCKPTDEICDGIDNDCDDEEDEDDVCPSGCRGDSFNGHNYMFCHQGGSQEGRDWQSAQQFCTDHGLQLARVETEKENEFIYLALNSLSGSGDAWMGASDQSTEDTWEWVAGNDRLPFYDAEDHHTLNDMFADWADGEPDNVPGSSGADCGVFEEQNNNQWQWADRNCSANHPRLVCEDVD